MSAPDPANDRDRVSPEELARLERRGRAVRLRLARVPYTEIAKQLGCSVDTVRRDIQLALREAVREPAEQMVAEQRAMVIELRSKMFAQALSGNMGAADRVIKLLDHEAKLFGLYSPTRVTLGSLEEDFATTAVKLMQSIGVRPPSELDRGPRAVEGTVDAPTVLDAEVVPEVADTRPEGDDDAWVN